MTYATRSLEELDEQDVARFRTYLPARVPGSCWIWQGYCIPAGYGRFTPTGTIKHYRAHRISYELEYGPIPPRMTLDHLCRNRRCVNPEHLEAVDNWTNVRRGVSPVALNARKTHCLNGHEFTPENTYVPPKRPTQRDCNQCKRDRRKNRRKTGTS